MRTAGDAYRTSSYSCQEPESFVYRSIENQPIRTILLVTNYRDIVAVEDAQHAELSLAFITENPPTDESTAENWPAPGQAV